MPNTRLKKKYYPNCVSKKSLTKLLVMQRVQFMICFYILLFGCLLNSFKLSVTANILEIAGQAQFSYKIFS